MLVTRNAESPRRHTSTHILTHRSLQLILIVILCHLNQTLARLKVDHRFIVELDGALLFPHRLLSGLVIPHLLPIYDTIGTFDRLLVINLFYKIDLVNFLSS